MAMKDWVKLPTTWIQNKGLTAFRWTAASGSDQAAALMVLVAMAHHADETKGTVHLTYETLCDITTLSRAKVSAGLKLLEERELVVRKPLGRRSSSQLTNYDPTKGWGKLPAKPLYPRAGGPISFFTELSLRKPIELHALKLYLLFVTRRDNATNLANISYDKIEEYTGIERDRIKSGLSLLAANSLVHVERLPAKGLDYGVSNAYRLVQLDGHIHMGTRGRGMDMDAMREMLG